MIVCGCAHTRMSHWLEWCALTHCIHEFMNSCIHTVDRHAAASSGYLGLQNQRLAVNVFFLSCWYILWSGATLYTSECEYAWFSTLSRCVYNSLNGFKLFKMNYWLRDVCNLIVRKKMYTQFMAAYALWNFRLKSIKQTNRLVIMKYTFPYVWFWPTFLSDINIVVFRNWKFGQMWLILK